MSISFIDGIYFFRLAGQKTLKVNSVDNNLLFNNNNKKVFQMLWENMYKIKHSHSWISFNNRKLTSPFAFFISLSSLFYCWFKHQKPQTDQTQDIEIQIENGQSFILRLFLSCYADTIKLILKHSSLVLSHVMWSPGLMQLRSWLLHQPRNI